MENRELTGIELEYIRRFQDLLNEFRTATNGIHGMYLDLDDGRGQSGLIVTVDIGCHIVDGIGRLNFEQE